MNKSRLTALEDQAQRVDAEQMRAFEVFWSKFSDAELMALSDGTAGPDLIARAKQGDRMPLPAEVVDIIRQRGGAVRVCWCDGECHCDAQLAGRVIGWEDAEE